MPSKEERVSLYHEADKIIEVLYKEHAYSLCGYAKTFLPKEDAEDAVQDVFATVIRKKEHQIENPRTYLYTSIKNRCLDYIRKNKKRVKAEALALLNDTDHKHNNTVIKMEVLDELRQRLNQLSGEEQKVLELKLRGYTIEEIASMLKKSPGTVSAQLASAKKKLLAAAGKKINPV